VRVQDPDPRLAAKLSDAISSQLIDLSSERRARASSGIDAFEHEPEIQALPPGSQSAVLAAAERVFSGSVAGSLHVTEAAAVPTKPVKPSIPLLIVLAGLGGLLLASAFALAWDSREPTVLMPAPTPYAPMQRYPPDGESGGDPPPDAWDGLVSESRPESGAGHH
jgi:hypothetical protein